MHNPIRELATDAPATAARLAALPQVAGVQVAGVVDGEMSRAVAGVTDVTTGEPVRDGTRFRPGSITKLLTATLVTRHADLNSPVTRYVPGPWGDILVRHLISHSSGLDAGDVFLDTGDGDDCVARYVEHLTTAGRLFAPGATFSYCNGGFVLAGRVIEVVLGLPWGQALRTHLLDPAGMTDTAFVDGRAAEHDLTTARGHTGQIAVDRRKDDPMASRAIGPAGGTLVSTAWDLARFAAQGTPEVMRTLHARAPGGVATMRGAGLGWMVWANAEQASVRIGGGYPGQSGIIAAAGDAVLVVLTNSDGGINAVTELLDAAGPSPGRRPEPAPADLSGYAGRYTSHVGSVDVDVVDGGLRMRAGGIPDLTLTPADRVTFTSAVGPYAFFDVDNTGVPGHFRWRMRVWRRTG